MTPTKGALFHAAVISDEHDEGFLAEFQTIQLSHQRANQLVHVADVIRVERRFVLRAWRAIRSTQRRSMNERHRIIDEEWPLSVSADEIDHKIMKEIGPILVFDVGQELPVVIVARLPIALAFVLVETNTPNHELIEAPGPAIFPRGEVAQLPPFAGDGGGI